MSVRTTHFIQALGRTIRVEEFAPATAHSDAERAALPTAFCVHGLTRTCLDFDAWGARAAATRGWRVLAPDVLGRGLSDWAPADAVVVEYGMRFYVPLMTEVIRQLLKLSAPAAPDAGEPPAAMLTRRLVDDSFRRAAPFVWVGQSMGGIMGWNACATTLRGLVTRLVLIDVGPELHMPGLVRISKYAGVPMEAANFATFKEMFRERTSVMSPLDDEQLQRFAANNARRLPSGIWTLHCDPAAPANLKNDCMDVVEPTQVWRAFESLDVPIVVIRGGDSDLLSAEGVEKMKAHQQPGRVTAVEVPGVGHVPLFQSDAEMAVLFDAVQPPAAATA
jgi:pimeloyl-ACP methyl ester carboxylesterase